MPLETKPRTPAEAAPLSAPVLVQLFRGELARSDTWRMRLDTTTNWSLTTTAAVLSLGFASPTVPHTILLIGVWMVFSFLLIEARRYRYYDLWNRRVRLMEDGYWAPLLRAEPIDADALSELAHEMSRPRIRLSLFSAMALRLNRAYGPILLVLLGGWFVKVNGHPVPAASFREVLLRAHVGPIGGTWVMAFMALSTVGFLLLFASAMIARPPLGEIQVGRTARRSFWEAILRPYGAPAVLRSRR